MVNLICMQNNWCHIVASNFPKYIHIYSHMHNNGWEWCQKEINRKEKKNENFCSSERETIPLGLLSLPDNWVLSAVYIFSCNLDVEQNSLSSHSVA